jgi:hypothetical protein
MADRKARAALAQVHPQGGDERKATGEAEGYVCRKSFSQNAVGGYIEVVPLAPVIARFAEIGARMRSAYP